LLGSSILLDVLFVGLGLAGFALLALYVIGCERL
jgi:hypothetical protein